jgi:2-hydroxychromene-2-carboxylate isomerase
VIDVYADVTCPFAYVGIERIVAVRDRLRSRELLHVKAWPLEVVNGEPLTGPGIAEKVRELRREVAPDLFHGFDPANFPSSSLPALALAAAGYRTSTPVGELVSLTLRRALFEDGGDVSDPDVLDAIARACAVTAPRAPADVLEDWEEGRRRGVQGSPHFFVDEEGFFCPALQIDHDGVLRVTDGGERFDAFTRRAFGAAGMVGGRS